MSHLSFQDKGTHTELSADYVVVGTGAGGATAAVQLARTGASVVMVEAGAWRKPEHYPESAYGGMRDLLDDFGATITRGRSLWPVVQARVVGGTTVVNSAICVRTPDDIFEQWQREHGTRPELGRDLSRQQDALDGEITIEMVPEQSRGRSTNLALEAAERVGLEAHVIRRYADGCEGSGQCLQGCRRAKKQSMNVNFVPEVMERGGTLVSTAPVKRVMFEGRRAVGVSGWFQHPDSRRWGGSFEVRALKAVVVAASATHSPALLQRSGVRSKALGQNFRAHPGTGVLGIYDEPVDMTHGATQGWASMQYRETPGLKLEGLSLPLDLLASRLPGAGSRLMQRLLLTRHVSMWVAAVRAESSGTVSNGFGDKPVVRYTMNKADMHRLRSGLASLARLHFEAGARSVAPCIYGLPFEITADEMHLLDNASLDPRNYFAVLSHLFGGCVMGADPSTSVVDDSGRVHGYEGLVVADASVIPTVLGVNPQHTIMAIARQWAQELSDRRRST